MSTIMPLLPTGCKTAKLPGVGGAKLGTASRAGRCPKLGDLGSDATNCSRAAMRSGPSAP